MRHWLPAGLVGVSLLAAGLAAQAQQARGAAESIGAAPAVRETRGGAVRYSFAATPGEVHVYLPDDMRAGDTISGTVYIEPNGADETTRRANADTLRGYTVDVAGVDAPVADGRFRLALTSALATISVIVRDGSGRSAGVERVPILDWSRPTGLNAITAPPVGQAGRPMSAPGPFDGDLGNTQAEIAGQPCEILAESPRQVVLMSPDAPTGPVQLMVRDGVHAFEGVYNNIRVALSAGRLTLARGERTIVTLRLDGLQGLRQPVDLALWASSTVSLQGGNRQTLAINPRAANAGGSFERQFDLRTLASGAFDVSVALIDSRETQVNEEGFIQFALQRSGMDADAGMLRRAAAIRLTEQERRHVAAVLRDAGRAAAESMELAQQLPTLSPETAMSAASIRTAAAAVDAAAVRQAFPALNGGLADLERSLGPAAGAAGLSQTQLAEQQRLLQQQLQILQTLSNISQTMHDTAASVAQRMR